MAKIALITDTHAGVRNDNPAFHDYQKRCFGWLMKCLDERKIKHLIHLGDIYDKRKHVNFLTSRRLRDDFFDPLQQRGIRAHILQGNHDSYYKNDHEVNALSELVDGRYNNVQTYSTPRIINIDGLDIQLLPWITKSNYDESMEVIKNPRAEIAMGHLEVNGFTMHRGLISDHGYDKSIFSKFDKVYSGHYHHRSTIDNVTYIGGFGEYTWHDYNDPRGFSVFDTETRQIEFIQNPYRMFNVFVYDDVCEDMLDKIKQTDYSGYADTYVKVLVENKSNPYTFDLVFDHLYKLGPLDIQIVEDTSLLTENDDEMEVDEAEDTPTILSKYIDNLTLPLESARMKRIMNDVYQEALQIETV